MLVETTLTAGTGARKRVIGVEIAVKPSFIRFLAKQIAVRSAGQPVEVELGSKSSGGAIFAGIATLAPGGMIVVIAKDE